MIVVNKEYKAVVHVFVQLIIIMIFHQLNNAKVAIIHGIIRNIKLLFFISVTCYGPNIDNCNTCDNPNRM